MKKLNLTKLMSYNPTLMTTFNNQLGQTVEIYEHPTMGDEYPVIAKIDNVAVLTDFYGTEDYFEDSDYNPVKVGDDIVCAFELQY